MTRLNYFLMLIVVAAMTNLGCIPKKTTYKHVVFDEVPHLRVLEKASGVELDSNGKPLKDQVMGLPVRLELIRANYKVQLETPINAEPIVFIQALPGSIESVVVSGPHIKEISGGGRYSFLAVDAKSRCLRMEIKNRDGKIVGSEELSYRLINRGYTWSIDAP